MTTRTKTVEFVADTDVSSLVAATNRDVTFDIYIPEDNPIFTSCSLWVSFSDNTTNTLDDPVVGISDDGVSFTETTMADQYNSFEVAWHQMRADVTSYFTANFDGATPPTMVTWYGRFRAPSDETNNHTFKLVITYDYDDTDTTQIKTVRIPIESTLASLTTSYQDLGGTTSIPAIEGAYLPETSVTVRQIWLELFAPSGNTSNITSTIRVDSTTETVWNSTTSSTSSYAQYMYGIVDITAEDLSTAIKLEALASTSSTCHNLGGFVCATYEFNASTSTSVLNSVLMPIPDVFHKGMTTTQGHDSVVRLNIQEPSPVLVESAVIGRTDYDDVQIVVGSQTSTEFTMTATQSYAADYTFVHRFDGSAAKTGGFTLARGDNDFDLSWNPDDTSGSNQYGWFTPYMVINYTSGKHAQGIGAHNRSTYSHLRDNIADTDVAFSTNGAEIGDANYWLNGVMADFTFHNSGREIVAMFPERAVGEGHQGYVRDVVAFTGNYSGSSEASTRLIYMDHTKQFMRHPLDPTDQKMDITATRNWRMFYDAQQDPDDAFGLWTTYHSCTYAWDIAVTGYTSDGSGITCYIWHVDSNTLLSTVVTATGGTASGVAYDDVSDHRATAQQGVLAGASLEVTL